MKKVTVQLVDDLDGSIIEDGSGSTVSLSLDGQAVELDLSSSNEARLREILEPYLGAGRKIGATRGTRTARRAGTPNRNPELQAIREWARANGIEVSERGRIAASVQLAYRAANEKPV